MESSMWKKAGKFLREQGSGDRFFRVIPCSYFAADQSLTVACISMVLYRRAESDLRN